MINVKKLVGTIDALVRHRLNAQLFVPSISELFDHFCFHRIDEVLLLLEALLGIVDVLLKELELINVQVAILRLLLELGLFLLSALLTPFHLVRKLFLLLLLFHVVNTVFGAGPLSLKHLVDHVLDIARSSLFFYFGPMLHNRILKLHSQFILLQCSLVSFCTVMIVVMEDVI